MEYLLIGSLCFLCVMIGWSLNKVTRRRQMDMSEEEYAKSIMKMNGIFYDIQKLSKEQCRWVINHPENIYYFHQKFVVKILPEEVQEFESL